MNHVAHVTTGLLGDEVVIVVMAHGQPLIVAGREQAIALADALLERVRSITAPDTITEAT